MRQFDFTLSFALDQPDADAEVYLERLMAEGCDDAIVGLGQRGHIALNFIREAESAIDAIVSALSDVRRAIPDAKLVEANPDMVGLTDIAELLNFSRQNMRKLVVKSGSRFPRPVHEGKPAIWHLSKVLTWLRERGTYQIDETLIDIAFVNMQCNLIKEERELDAGVSQRLRSVVR